MPIKPQPGAEWIAQAYDDWLVAIDEASGFSRRIESAGVTHVILLGLAQHGKTTLALRLLEATSADAIGEALRGGRLQGQSATPGPIGYFACEAGATLDCSAITREVERIFDAFNAARTEEGHRKVLFSDLPEIPIPSRNPTSPFKVVDMAGFDGRETWAEMAAGYWTARADYTILVIQAEKISQLMGEDFKPVIAQFKNRWTHSDSMLVVTTGSFEQKPNPAEEGLGWEAISKLRREQFYRDALADSSITLDKIELFPMSLLPGDGQADDPLTQESLARLKARLSGPTLLTRLSNAEVLRCDRIAALKVRRRPLELKQDHLGERLMVMEAADKGALEATKECAKFIQELPEIESGYYDMQAVDENTRHDIYKIQEPVNAFAFHANRLADYQGDQKRRLKNLHNRFNFFPLDELATVLQSQVHPVDLATDLREPIADEDFKKRKRSFLTLYFKHYDEAESGKALHQKMVERKWAMVSELKHCGGRFREQIVALAETFEGQLNKFRKAKGQELDQCRAEATQVQEALEDLDRRQAALPPIPDLVVSLKSAFTQVWNDLVAKANETDLDTNAIAELFLEQWTMKEDLEKVEARFGSTEN